MNQAGHWTNDELLASLYGVGPSGDHLRECAGCQSRLAAMQSSRETVERAAATGDAVTASFLAAQRRSIYQRLDQRPVRWRSWVAGLATACVLAGSLFLYQQNHAMKLEQERANDAKLVQEVAAMANDTGTSSMAPLEGLFE
jgi:hypothetical protein